jgi:hypothetical protein
MDFEPEEKTMTEREKQIRSEYKAALAKRDFETALGIVLKSPDIFGTPPSDAPVEIAAVATDPTEPKYMIVEWSVMKQTCKKPKALCSEYILRSSQFDHKPEGVSQVELEEWFQKYVDNRVKHKGGGRRLGVTLYLLEVKEIKQITNFEGELIDG